MKIFSGGNPSLRIRIAISSLVLMVGVFLLAIECQAEPLLLSAQPVQSIGEVPAGPPDSIVQITAEAQGLPAVAYDNLPPYGTYWEMLPSGLMPPLPFPPTDPTLPIFAIADNIFLVDATGGQVTVHARQLGSMRLTRITTSDATESALEAQATAIVNLINQWRFWGWQRRRLRQHLFGLHVRHKSTVAGNHERLKRLVIFESAQCHQSGLCHLGHHESADAVCAMAGGNGSLADGHQLYALCVAEL